MNENTPTTIVPSRTFRYTKIALATITVGAVVYYLRNTSLKAALDVDVQS